jgi:hypothetical protein
MLALHIQCYQKYELALCSESKLIFQKFSFMCHEINIKTVKIRLKENIVSCNCRTVAIVYLFITEHTFKIHHYVNQ